MKKIIREQARWPKRWPIAGAALAITVIAFSGPVLAAKGGIPGPPTGGETPNNLSVPGVQTQSSQTIAAFWSPPGEAVLGVHYSYGCDAPESDGQFSYPNTSCVDSLSSPSTYYTAEQCTDEVQPSPCQGMSVERIYWQKVDVNDWWADDTGVLPNVEYVDHVDWGDALEAVSWNERSVIRVETQAWASTIDGFDPMSQANDCVEAAIDPAIDCKIGLQMWHVSGQGITEHWGVRAADIAPFDSFNYDTPFQIIKSTQARLNLTKLGTDPALCSEPGGNPGDDPPEITEWTGSGWVGTAEAEVCQWSDAPYSVETSVGGKFVNGYNWRMKNVELESVCGVDWDKTGFWRLTYYAPDVMFDDELAPNVAPPAMPVALRALPRTEFIVTDPPDPPEPEPAVAAAEPESEDPGEDDRLYKPVVDVANNLSYIDICIKAKTKGGGGGGGKGGKGGGGGGGGKGGGGGNH
jgi:uncharacterized membrane protein YgcG